MSIVRLLPLRRVGLAAALASLPLSLLAQNAPNKPAPPRLSTLMGLTNAWQQEAQDARVHRDTLLRWQSESRLPASDPYSDLNIAATAVQNVSRVLDHVPATSPREAAEEATIVLPEHARPTDYAASGFAPAALGSGYSHAKFAADMLAAPARTQLATDARHAWLGEAPALSASTTSAEQMSQVPTAPGQIALPGASFAGVAYASHDVVPDVRVTSYPAATVSLPEAINANSVVYGWGNNSNGQQGSTTTSGSTTGITSPTQITSIPGSGIPAVAAGGAFALYLRNGTVYAAGNNFYGQLANSNNVGNSSAVNATPTQVSVLPSGATTLISGGTNFALALSNGTLYGWGFNSGGQTGNGPTVGTSNANPTPTAVSGAPSGITALSAGGSHSLVLAGGNVYAFGLNNNGQLGNTTNNGANGTANNTPNPTPTLVAGLPGIVTAIATGSAHSLALTSGNVYAWGLNQFGQLGNTTNNQAGTNVATPTPTRVAGLPSGQVIGISAGANFSLALANGNVFSWGFNGSGQLGNGTTTGTTVANPTPYQVQFNGSALGGIVQVAANSTASYALASDGSLYVWGGNLNGQLGLGNNTNFSTPQRLLPPSGQFYQAIETDSGGAFVLAIVGDSPVPEPATWAGGMLLLATAGWTLRRRLLALLKA